ncbi:hypothetical protein B0H17DRAFT_1210834 [Mycena rosella]|uniref:F-box domain-containing protein n=1 Tax=Mycena rosella TaxID=1033263 RepID=A0AAD7CWL3_MYCRO|nr:hypothetical protein B0H17DRAFT_1210834 [Mycena rosella]
MATNALEPDLHHTHLSIAPILRTPPEILQQIFTGCFDTRFPHPQPFSSAEAPLLLCGVCRLWRALAISTPELWAHISVSIGRHTPETVKPSPHLVKNWIARSGCQPITFVLQDLGLPSSCPDIANDLLKIFLPQIHRWQSVTLILPNHDFPASLTALEIPFGRASLLQIAKFEFGVETGLGLNAEIPQIGGLSRILGSSSQLHTLYWRNDLYTLEFIEVRWAQLTVVDLVPLWRPMSQIIDVMRKAPLRSLSAFIADASGHVAAPLVLPDLLILWIGTEVDLSPLFRQLTLPSLQNINVFCANPVIPQTEVVRCIARSGCLVNTAILKSLRIPKAELITFLRSSPSLRLLDISNGGEVTITDDILSLLTVRDEPCVCPNLRIIRFLESSVFSADGVLADMVASRLEAIPSATLSRLSVHFSDADLPGHWEDIRRLKGLGDATDCRVWINEPETA